MENFRRTLLIVTISTSIVISNFCFGQSVFRLKVSEDSYTLDGSGQNTNYGGETTIAVKTASAGFIREGFLKFDLTKIPATPEEIDSVLLQVFISKVDKEMELSVYTVSSTWDENTLTSSNAPGVIQDGNHLIGTHTLLKNNVDYLKKLDVTGHLKDSLTSQKDNLSFVLIGDGVSKGIATIGSRENATLNAAASLTVYTTKEVDLEAGLEAYPPFTFGQRTITTPENGVYIADLLGEVTTVAPLSKYGGWLKKNLGATGFFHTKKIDGEWYMVDPDGYQFMTMGIVSVEKNDQHKLPEDLKKWGINALGNWSDDDIANIPFCVRFNFMQGFKNTDPALKTLFDDNIFPVFDPRYAGYVDESAKEFVKPYKSNPWIIGYQTDNELQLHQISLDEYLALPPQNPNRIAADSWMVSRKGAGYVLAAEDRAEFKGYVTEVYMKTVNDALKKYDANHLNIGSRLHGTTKYVPEIVKAIGENVDVNSVNFYSRWEPFNTTLDLWNDVGGKPFMITEFYTKGEDSGEQNDNGAGWRVDNQEDRADFFENFALKILSHAGCVGWTWFRYIDNEESNKGLFTSTYQVYEPLANAMKNLSKDVYNLRNFLREQPLDLEEFVLGVDKEIGSKEESMFFYPNPAKDVLHIDLAKGSGAYQLIEVYTIDGLKVHEQTLRNSVETMTVDELKEGMYFVVLTGEGERKHVAKLLIRH